MTSTYDARTILKNFDFDENVRSLLAFSDADKIRLDPTSRRILLKRDAVTALYPVADATAFVTTWTTNPAARLAWLAFEAIVETKENDIGTVVTSYRYRLTNGSSVRYWTGTAWAVATTQWNTEAEINAGLASWPYAALGVVVNPRTSDGTITPEVVSFRFAYSARIDLLKDVMTSFMSTLAAGLRSWRQHVLITKASTSSLNLTVDYPLELDLTIAGIRAVYNHDDDPTHATNLFSSWTAPVITLLSAIPTNKRVWIDLEYTPRVAFATDVDYYEVSKIPSVWVEDLSISTRKGSGREFVLRRDTNVAYRTTGTRVGNVEPLLSIQTSSPDDHLRLAGQVEEFFAITRQVRSIGLDEVYDIDILETYSGRSGPDSEGRASNRYRVRISNVLLAASSEAGYGIKTFDLDLVRG
jgi:hypothetical protein